MDNLDTVPSDCFRITDLLHDAAWPLTVSGRLDSPSQTP
jgi:hypothetical protein